MLLSVSPTLACDIFKSLPRYRRRGPTLDIDLVANLARQHPLDDTPSIHTQRLQQGVGR